MGTFIVFEGGDGAGKTTQLARLAERLRCEGKTVVTTREPGGSPTLGAQVRKMLLESGGFGDRAEALLFAAERAEHVRTVIAPALERGDVVLCDRFVDSTLAYQGAGRGLDMKALLSLCDFATGGLYPDAVVVLDLSAADAAARQDGRGEADRMEKAGLGGVVRNLLLDRAGADPEHYTVVDASGTLDEVERRLYVQLAALLRW